MKVGHKNLWPPEEGDGTKKVENHWFCRTKHSQAWELGCVGRSSFILLSMMAEPTNKTTFCKFKTQVRSAQSLTLKKSDVLSVFLFVWAAELFLVVVIYNHVV